MALRFWLILAIVATAMVEFTTCETETLTAHFALGGFVGNYIVDDEEMMMESEVSRRLLAQNKRYISYGALKAGSTPCNKRGSSYYNCNSRSKANPYKRGCSKITHCYRYTH